MYSLIASRTTAITCLSERATVLIVELFWITCSIENSEVQCRKYGIYKKMQVCARPAARVRRVPGRLTTEIRWYPKEDAGLRQAGRPSAEGNWTSYDGNTMVS